MIALDTNVLVRVLTNDDPAQTRIALARLRDESLFLARTVVLETEWVLRFTYRLSREEIAAAFRRLLGLGPLEVEQRPVVVQALSWYGSGMDFADALHLAACGEASPFLTFDRELEGAARKLPEAPIVELLRAV